MCIVELIKLSRAVAQRIARVVGAQSRVAIVQEYVWQLVAPFIPVDEHTLVAQSLHDAAIVVPHTEVRSVLIARWHEQPVATVWPVRDGRRNSRDSLPPEVPKRNI